MGKVFKALEKANEDYGAATEERKSTIEMEKRPSPNMDATAERITARVEEPEPTREQVLQAGHWDERLLKVTGFSSRLSESFRVLRSRILHPREDGQTLKTILVSSTAPGEGKSFVTANLGISIARGMDQHCLMVDCDLRRPTLAGLLGMRNEPGLSDYLQKKTDVAQTIQRTSVDKLSLLASGRPPVNPSELLGSSRMEGLVEEISRRYDDRFIIFDSPPIQAASETSILAQRVDGVVLVVRWGVSGREQVKRLVEDIGKEKVIGVVFNGYKSNIVESKILKYYDYYHYEYTHEEKRLRR